MTFLVERLADLRTHLDHLDALRDRVEDAATLERDMSLRNDVLFSLLSVAQHVIDIAGELAARRGQRFADYTEAVRSLRAYDEFDDALIDRLARLPGFRNVLIHEYVALDLERVVEALNELEPVERFHRTVTGLVGGLNSQ